MAFDSLGANSSFVPEWAPSKALERSFVDIPGVKPKSFTGLEVIPIKDALYRELRSVEYFEHLIQKTRFELEQIESEIFWQETANTRLTKHMGIVDSQFNDTDNSGHLLESDTLIADDLFAPANERKLAYYRELEAFYKKTAPEVGYEPNKLNSETYGGPATSKP
jgi:hypothetical protein